MTRGEPERTCVGCREKAPKRSLVRIVASGRELWIDRSGSAPGRAAYLHERPECVREALRRGGVPRALRTTIPAGEVSNLLTKIASTEGA